MKNMRKTRTFYDYEKGKKIKVSKQNYNTSKKLKQILQGA